MTKRERLVYSYMVALSRLYGILEWKQFIKVFNKYNHPKITKTEINNTPYYWNKRADYCELYRDVLVYSRVDKELVDEAMFQAEGKKYYMPTEDEIISLSKPKDYMPESEAHMALYAKIKNILLNNPSKDISVDEMCKRICVTLLLMIAAGERQHRVFDFLSNIGQGGTEIEYTQELIDILMSVWNNTRMWANRGYTPNEMIAKIPKNTEPNQQKITSGINTKAPDTKNAFAVQFYKLWYKLIYWVNEKYKIVDPFPIPIYGQRVNEEPFFKVREFLWNNSHYIDDFLASNAARDLSGLERQTVRDWGEKFIKGKFLVYDHLPDYSVFQSFEEEDDSDQLYGVCGITNAVSSTLGGRATPLLVDTVLLPFKGKIVYDTFMMPYSISFSGYIKDSFVQFYQETLSTLGIITTL